MRFRVRFVQDRSEDHCWSARFQEPDPVDAAGRGGADIHWWYCACPASELDILTVPDRKVSFLSTLQNPGWQ